MDTPKLIVKFKCGQAPNIPDEEKTFPSTEKVISIKHNLLRAWPCKWPRARTPSDLRLIFLGRELKDDELLSNLKEKTKMDVLTMHMIVRERNPGSPTTPLISSPINYNTQSPQRTPIRQPKFNDDADEEGKNEQQEEGEEEQEPHFHAVTVSEKELNEFRMIFDRKKGPDGLITMTTVTAVLKSYWRFIHREGFEIDQGQPFPEHRLEQLRRKIEGSSENVNGLTLDQFLSIFYLFDNVAPEEKCIHGEKERVRMATAQLHSIMQPQHEFYHDKFDQLFVLVCGDENGLALTCKEMELLYYMYSAFVLEKVREEELVSKVQAIVRMKIQVNKYTKTVQAARTLQNAWRMRMFVSDRQNHERIAEFLKAMMSTAGTDKTPGRRL